LCPIGDADLLKDEAQGAFTASSPISSPPRGDVGTM
jgi:hypothetical protein